MTVAPYVIPLIAANQQVTVALGLDTYTLTVRFNDQQDPCWIMSIDDSDGNRLLSGAPLVTGCDFLEQFEYLGIPGQLTVQTDHDPSAVPTYTDLGISSFLYYVTTAP